MSLLERKADRWGRTKATKSQLCLASQNSEQKVGEKRRRSHAIWGGESNKPYDNAEQTTKKEGITTSWDKRRNCSSRRTRLSTYLRGNRE